MRRRDLLLQGSAFGLGTWLGCSTTGKGAGDTGGSEPGSAGGTSGSGADATSGSSTAASTTGTDLHTGPFSTPLPIPPLEEGTLDGGVRTIDLVVQHGTHEFVPGVPSDTLGYNGDLLGPTLRVRRGETVRIRVENRLDEPTTVHWHGAHLPAAMDGGPHQLISPGETWTAEWTVLQPGCTMWYHPHPEGETARQVFLGLAGFFFIEDDDRDALGLPATYGVDDVPLVIQDRRLTPDGRVVYAPTEDDLVDGYLGDTYLVNGAIEPYLDVAAGLLRLRVLNGANARVIDFALSDGTPFHLVGTDAGLLEAPVELDAVRLSPGERVEIVLDLSGRLGETVVPVDRSTGAELLQLHVTREGEGGAALPASLVSLPRLDPADAVRTRTFELGMGGMGGGGIRFTINGVTMDMEVVNEVVPVGEVEIWEVSSQSGMMNVTHNFHMHGHHFEVLSRNGAAPPPHEAGLKDTVLLEPGDVVRLLVRHEDYTDSELPYMYHCHVLEHEDQGMMGQFVVV